ncbi:MAG TPA: helix-turn-helix domain-containing protein [Propioniciclava sp.]|uniref:TetR/AcrR family transcriptional regulator n=1 Tax=Propioniciclava sp. TaxID=2038686 RepID=UPI002BB06059|nr:helix-turn-helix domain-containing protein [Propioniciclava sp.]HRL47844.1 helix-turn-helix domain-containing protein [Propioniciclava sp.]HRL78772.1 helix-turn-helix domain-containing protein [Propioniciclava sp.]
MRADTERNRRRLIRSAAYLIARKGSAVKMADVAEHAEVSTATAYRHFTSVEDILIQFRRDVGQRLLVFSEKQTAVGVELLTTVSREWVTIVLRHGGAMIHTRSETGYLTRLRDRTEYLTAQAQALQHPIASAAEELGLGNPGDIGLFLWNILFDAREIIDLRDSEHLDADGINARLIGTLCGALRGWQAADARDAAPAAP